MGPGGRGFGQHGLLYAQTAGERVRFGTGRPGRQRGGCQGGGQCGRGKERRENGTCAEEGLLQVGEKGGLDLEDGTPPAPNAPTRVTSRLILVTSRPVLVSSHAVAITSHAT
eukprot:1778513-Rhodomonas_salina.1